jgi:hypothetical protein
MALTTRSRSLKVVAVGGGSHGEAGRKEPAFADMGFDDGVFFGSGG